MNEFSIWPLLFPLSFWYHVVVIIAVVAFQQFTRACNIIKLAASIDFGIHSELNFQKYKGQYRDDRNIVSWRHIVNLKWWTLTTALVAHSLDRLAEWLFCIFLYKNFIFFFRSRVELNCEFYFISIDSFLFLSNLFAISLELSCNFLSVVKFQSLLFIFIFCGMLKMEKISNSIFFIYLFICNNQESNLNFLLNGIFLFLLFDLWTDYSYVIGRSSALSSFTSRYLTVINNKQLAIFTSHHPTASLIFSIKFLNDKLHFYHHQSTGKLLNKAAKYFP